MKMRRLVPFGLAAVYLVAVIGASFHVLHEDVEAPHCTLGDAHWTSDCGGCDDPGHHHHGSGHDPSTCTICSSSHVGAEPSSAQADPAPGSAPGILAAVHTPDYHEVLHHTARAPPASPSFPL